MPNINPIILSGGGGSTPGWTPPADVQTVVDNAFALISSGENKFVALYMAYPDIENYIAFRVYFSGTGTVDFGDGSAASSVTSGTVKEAVLDYANIPGGVISSLGAKLAVVEFEATGDITDIRFNEWHSTLGTKSIAVQNWYAAKCCTNTTTFTRIFALIERMMILDIDKPIATAFGLPYNCKKLTWAGMSITGSNNWASSMFRFCNQLNSLFFSTDDLASLPWSQTNTMQYCFQEVHSALPMNFEVDIDNCTSLLSAWLACYAFSIIKLGNTGNVATILKAIYASGVEVFEMDDASGVTTTTNFIRPLAQYNVLKRLILTGLTVGIDISYSPIGFDNMNVLYNSIGTVPAGSQTLIVTGCLSSGTVAIATAKGWNVTT